MKAFIVSALKSKRGASSVEMGLILALIVLSLLTALQAFAEGSIAMWDNVSAKTADAISGSAN